MKRFAVIILSLSLILLLTACGNNATPIVESDHKEISEPMLTSAPDNEESQSVMLDISDYERQLVFPEKGITCEYYSYGYHWSTVTVIDYTYKVLEQSSEKIRIDFDFDCRADYLGENTAGTSFCFLIGVYTKAGEKIDDVIVDVQDGIVGDTIDKTYTLLLNKSDVINGIQLKFEGNNPADAELSSSSTKSESIQDETVELVGGLRPEFKEAMDSYKAFYTEYCEFMKEYSKNPSDLTLLANYVNLLAKAEEMNEAFEDWNEAELNNEELEYYLDVNNQVMQMLVDAAS